MTATPRTLRIGMSVGAMLLAVSFAAPVLAQRAPMPLDSVPIGAFVRLRTAARDFKSTLLARTASVIEVELGFDIRTARTPDTTFTVVRSALLGGAVRTGSRWRTGAVIGAAGLGAAGGILGCLYACGDPEISEVTVAYGVAVGAVAGTILGAGVGHFLKSWTPPEGLSLGATLTH